ncbi:hypothetical protein ABT116_06475, partial [Streptomyces sp. NPDC002130]
MRRAEHPSRRTVLAAAVGVAVAAGAGPAAADPEALMTTDTADPARTVPARTVDNRFCAPFGWSRDAQCWLRTWLRASTWGR